MKSNKKQRIRIFLWEQGSKKSKISKLKAPPRNRVGPRLRHIVIRPFPDVAVPTTDEICFRLNGARRASIADTFSVKLSF